MKGDEPREERTKVWCLGEKMSNGQYALPLNRPFGIRELKTAVKLGIEDVVLPELSRDLAEKALSLWPANNPAPPRLRYINERLDVIKQVILADEMAAAGIQVWT